MVLCIACVGLQQVVAHYIDKCHAAEQAQQCARTLLPRMVRLCMLPYAYGYGYTLMYTNQLNFPRAAVCACVRVCLSAHVILLHIYIASSVFSSATI